MDRLLGKTRTNFKENASKSQFFNKKSEDMAIYKLKICPKKAISTVEKIIFLATFEDPNDQWNQKYV